MQYKHKKTNPIVMADTQNQSEKKESNIKNAADLILISGVFLMFFKEGSHSGRTLVGLFSSNGVYE